MDAALFKRQAVMRAELRARKLVELHDFLSERSDNDSALRILKPRARDFLQTAAGREAGPLWADNYEGVRNRAEAFLNRSRHSVVSDDVCQQIDLESYLAVEYANFRFANLFIDVPAIEKRAEFDSIVQGLDLGPDIG